MHGAVEWDFRSYIDWLAVRLNDRPWHDCTSAHKSLSQILTKLFALCTRKFLAITVPVPLREGASPQNVRAGFPDAKHSLWKKMNVPRTERTTCRYVSASARPATPRVLHDLNYA